MTSSNRTANRVVLVLVGVLALALAALVAWPHLDVPAIALPGADDPTATAVILAAAVVVIAFAVAWIATRGRGRTRYAVDAGGVRLDAGAVESVARAHWEGSADVVGVRVRSFTVRGTPMLLLTVQARRHADITALRADLRRAIERIDAVVGTPLPLAAHLTTGVRTAVTGTRTAH